MYVMFTTGIALWLAYAFLIESMPMIIANIITFALSATILVLKLNEKSSTTRQ
jgi:MtN3 and saliva related transmembrane protein